MSFSQIPGLLSLSAIHSVVYCTEKIQRNSALILLKRVTLQNYLTFLIDSLWIRIIMLSSKGFCEGQQRQNIILSQCWQCSLCFLSQFSRIKTWPVTDNWWKEIEASEKEKVFTDANYDHYLLKIPWNYDLFNNIWHRWLVPWGVNGNEVIIIILLVVVSSFYTSKQSKLNSIWKQNYNEKHRDFDFEFISNKVPICLCTVSFKILDNLNIKILGKY